MFSLIGGSVGGWTVTFVDARMSHKIKLYILGWVNKDIFASPDSLNYNKNHLESQTKHVTVALFLSEGRNKGHGVFTCI